MNPLKNGNYYYFVLGKKVIFKCPGCISNYFVYISAVSNSFVALVFIHDGATFALVSQLIAANYTKKL